MECPRYRLVGCGERIDDPEHGTPIIGRRLRPRRGNQNPEGFGEESHQKNGIEKLVPIKARDKKEGTTDTRTDTRGF